MIKNINEISLISYDNIRYLLSSEIRIKMLRVLYEKDSSFDEIKHYIHKQDTNLLRTLKELQELNLVEYRNKIYSLTSTGYLAIRNIMNVFENWHSITKYANCINYHSFKNLPLEFARYLFILDESERIESTDADYYLTRKLYGEKIRDATDLKIIMPVYSKHYIDPIRNTIINNNANLQLVTSRNIYNAIKESLYADEFKQFKKDEKIRLWVTEEDVHEIFLTITDKASAVSFFYKDDTFDDTTFFWDEKFKSKKILGYMFESYKHKMSAKEVK